MDEIKEKIKHDQVKFIGVNNKFYLFSTLKGKIVEINNDAAILISGKRKKVTNEDLGFLSNLNNII